MSISSSEAAPHPHPWEKGMTHSNLPLVLVSIHKSYFYGTALNMVECFLTRKKYLGYLVGLHKVRTQSPSGMKLKYYPYTAHERVFVEITDAEYQRLLSFHRVKDMNYDPLCYIRECLSAPSGSIFMETHRRELAVNLHDLHALDIRIYNKYNSMSSLPMTSLLNFNVTYKNLCWWHVHGVRKLPPSDIKSMLTFARYDGRLINPIFNQ